MGVVETLEKWGRVGLVAFGPKLLVGFLLEMFSDTTPGQVYECIISKRSISQISDTEWNKYSGFAKNAHLENFDWDKFLQNLKKTFQRRRPDIYSILDNTPGGWDWLNEQIALIKQKLGV